MNEGFVNPIVASKIPRLAIDSQLAKNSGQNQTYWYGFGVWQKVQSTVPSGHHDEICSSIRNTRWRLLL